LWAKSDHCRCGPSQIANSEAGARNKRTIGCPTCGHQHRDVRGIASGHRAEPGFQRLLSEQSVGFGRPLLHNCHEWAEYLPRAVTVVLILDSCIALCIPRLDVIAEVVCECIECCGRILVVHYTDVCR